MKIRRDTSDIPIFKMAVAAILNFSMGCYIVSYASILKCNVSKYIDLGPNDIASMFQMLIFHFIKAEISQIKTWCILKERYSSFDCKAIYASNVFKIHLNIKCIQNKFEYRSNKGKSKFTGSQAIFLFSRCQWRPS